MKKNPVETYKGLQRQKNPENIWVIRTRQHWRLTLRVYFSHLSHIHAHMDICMYVYKYTRNNLMMN